MFREIRQSRLLGTRIRPKMSSSSRNGVFESGSFFRFLHRRPILHLPRRFAVAFATRMKGGGVFFQAIRQPALLLDSVELGPGLKEPCQRAFPQVGPFAHWRQIFAASSSVAFVFIAWDLWLCVLALLGSTVKTKLPRAD